MLKKLFVLRIGNYRPDLCEYTIPTIKNWASKNDYHYEEIIQRVFDEKYPITIEKMQVHGLGAGSEWNILCDADLMLRPDFIDPVSFTNYNTVASSYHFDADQKFQVNKYFMRDGRNLGLSGGFVLSSFMTHDIWKHLNPDVALEGTSRNPHLIDEYMISTNLAKYGLKYDGVSHNPDEYILHFGDADKTEEEKRAGACKARELWESWILIWPELVKHAKI